MIETNGIRLNVREFGQGNAKTAILLHGFPEGSYAWEDVGARLAREGYRVWVPDQRGYNLSDKPARVSDYNSDTLARDVVGLIDAAGCRQVDLIGHDWGGQVAWWTAARFPERIRRLVVINCPHPHVMLRNVMLNPRQTVRSWYIFVLQLPWIPEAMLTSHGFAMMRGLMAEVGADERYLEAWSQPGAFTAMINWYRAAFRTRPMSLPDPRIHMPALLLWSEKDRYLDRSLAKPSMRYCDQGRLELLAGATHWVHHENPEMVVRLIRDFLA
jgi:pimeloyl-ACP methyl ester carboxylesterase